MIYIGLVTQGAEEGQAGLTISEPTSGKYKRMPIQVGGPAKVTWQNEGLTPWAILGLVLLGSPSGGTVLSAGKLDVPLVIRLNDTVEVKTLVTDDLDFVISGEQ